MTGAGAGPRRYALPALSGGLLALAFPPLHLLLPPFLALVPLALWIEGVGWGGVRGGADPRDGVCDVGGGGPGRGGAALAPDGRSAFRGGLLFGAVAWGLLLHWMPLSLGRFTLWAWPGWAVAVALLSLHAGAVVWVLHRLRHRTGVPLWLALPLAWTAGEVVRATLPGSLAFPWLELATGLTAVPELLGLAELAGSRGVGFWLALVQGLVAWTVVGACVAGRVVGRVAAIRSVITTTVFLVPALLSVYRANHLDMRPAARVAVVQPSVAQELKLRDPVVAADRGLRTAERWADSAGRLEDVDAVVLPEAVVPLGGMEGTFRDRVEALADRLATPVLLGSLAREGAVPFNSVFLVLPESGVQSERYDKRHLVPVVERVPLGPFAEGLRSRGGGGSAGGGAPPARGDRYGSFGFGTGPEVLGVPAMGPLVCWESAFAGAARSRRRAGARILVNLTNDAWFNGPTVWHRSVALWQHPAHLVLRAVETRTGVVRAANTGLSLTVDPVGRRELLVAPWVEAVAITTVLSTDASTLWVRTGDVPAGAVTVATLLLIGLGFARRGGSSR